MYTYRHPAYVNLVERRNKVEYFRQKICLDKSRNEFPLDWNLDLFCWLQFEWMAVVLRTQWSHYTEVTSYSCNNNFN